MVRVLARPFFFVSLSLLPPGLGGIAVRLPAVACGSMVFSDQSEGWENRALSLERDFIDAVGPDSSPTHRSFLLDGAGQVRFAVIGLYGEIGLGAKLQIRAFPS